ncbi:arginine N-succinyltransferase [Chimaeribacter arupi]|jgi:arginine N-succinyltransferase|uniref:Arginine N-succinyltransferase n=3 Tax=Enterobacterales TaxID=91347 RepID=A0A2N5EJK8_9GAMM|nr:arginine N-succinyltransferase [Nissabacter archeti]PLR31052.1 arginine N-succinyltransferase [Chimaeribacter arupi]PLR42951.1 arginine N-succinyltransferase [Chimaeribacter arupi]PLR45936.1 arginine N-succinyltransferase [Chimaeribacter arupi]PLR51996.1 arginine N-succinyltransferase [Chimaeribacter arupi]
MMLFRPVRETDLNDILDLSARAGVGLTSLPNNPDRLRARITRSLETFAGLRPKSQQGFLFVLEDTELAKVVGVSAIEVAVGLDEPFYNFRIQRTVRASRELGVYKNLDTLYLSYDHTGHSELCTLFLDPAYQRNRNGLFLSKARFLFIAAFREFFSSHLFAELRGVVDNGGRSAFWDALGHHFFEIPFAEADYLTGIGSKTFIAELMPSYPIYISLLPEPAQQVIGQVHPQTAPARAILEKEGLMWRGSVDIFDAGPVLEGETDAIRAVRASRVLPVRHRDPATGGGALCIVANQHFEDFRALLIEADADAAALDLTGPMIDALHLADGDAARLVSLLPEELPA